MQNLAKVTTIGITVKVTTIGINYRDLITVILLTMDQVVVFAIIHFFVLNNPPRLPIIINGMESRYPVVNLGNLEGWLGGPLKLKLLTMLVVVIGDRRAKTEI